MANGKLTSKKLQFRRFYLVLLALCFGVVALCIATLFNFSPSSLTPTLLHKDLRPLPPLQIGDMILREGIGIESVVIKLLSKHRYTHIGLVVSSKPIIILHATPDDNLKMPNQVILSSIDEFLSHAQNIAIKRLNLSKAQKEHIALQVSAYLGKTFVLDSNKGALYCTTLLEQILSPIIPLNIDYERIDLPAFSGDYLFPKAFYEDSNSTLIYESRAY